MFNRFLGFIFNRNKNDSNKEELHDEIWYKSKRLDVFRIIDGSFVGTEINNLISENDRNIKLIKLSDELNDSNLRGTRYIEILKNNCRIASLLYGVATSNCDRIDISEIKYLKEMKDKCDREYTEYMYSIS